MSKAGETAQSIYKVLLCSIDEDLSSSPRIYVYQKAGVLTHVCNSSTGEVGKGGSPKPPGQSAWPNL